MFCALIGHGYWGHILGSKLIKSEVFNLRYICDFKAWDREHYSYYKSKNIHVTEEIEDILIDPLVTTVFIATPPETHYSIASRVLSSAKHVWLEKPCCTSLKQITYLQNLAQQKNKTLHLGFITLYSSSLALMKKKIERRAKTGSVQKLTFIRENYLHTGASASSPFDILYDLGVHDLVMLHYLYPQIKPNSLSISYEEIIEPYCHWIFEFQNNDLDIKLKLSWDAPVKTRSCIWAQKGHTLSLENNELPFIRSMKSDSSSTNKNNSEEDLLEKEINSFYRDIQSSQSNIQFWDAAIFFHELMEMLQK